MLELANLEAYYGSSRALSDVSLSVGRGELVGVLGRNGVGKTTLLRTVMGLMGHARGTIQLGGEDITRRRTDQRAKAGLGYVPQGRGILPRFTVLENLRVGLFANTNAQRGAEERMFAIFPMLKQHLNRLGGNLSGGQQQQLAIARALLTEPKVILLDEPTEGIQPNIVEEIEETIVRLNHEQGIAMILVEQNVPFVRHAANHFIVLEKGSVVARGAPGDLTEDLVEQHMAV